MTNAVQPFSDEQARALVNLRPRYEALIEAERELAGLPYNLVRKRVAGHEYLYEATDRLNNGKSLGPMSPELEQKLAEYQATKRALQERRNTAQELVRESGRLARPLRLPMLSSAAPAPQLFAKLCRLIIWHSRGPSRTSLRAMS